MDLGRLAEHYSHELTEKILPFWLETSIDDVYGGYFNVISNVGEVVSTDKSLAWHGQQCYTFAKLYEYFDTEPKYLAYAKHGADFLLKVIDDKSEMPSVTDRTGRCIKLNNDITTEALVLLGLVATSKLADNLSEFIKSAVLKLLKKREKKMAQINFNQSQFKNLFEITAIAQLLIESKGLMSDKVFVQKATALLDELQMQFWEPRAEILLTNVALSGGYCESIEGRNINPAAIFEAASVFIDLSELLKKRKITMRLAQQIFYIAQTTWDEKYGGFYHVLDIKNAPASQASDLQKTLRTQLSAMSALLKANKFLNKVEVEKLWLRSHDYTWQNYPDFAKAGEWHNVLSQQGEPLLALKATHQHNAFYSALQLAECMKLMK